MINYHHLTGPGGGLGVAFGIAPQKPEAGRLLLEAAAEALGWTSLDPVKESVRELTTGEPRASDCISTSQATKNGIRLSIWFEMAKTLSPGLIRTSQTTWPANGQRVRKVFNEKTLRFGPRDWAAPASV